jgi:hypothetical protein
VCAKQRIKFLKCLVSCCFLLIFRNLKNNLKISLKKFAKFKISLYICIVKQLKLKKMIALFQEGIGQTTHFLNAKECLEFPYDNTRYFWYEDREGNKYSFFEAMSKFYK